MASGTDSTERFDRLRLRRLRKVYGRLPVLVDIDAELPLGLTVLMGPNGAGKSTLLSILATLSAPTSGDVLYGEVPFRVARRRLRHRVGLLGHAPQLYRHLTARENLRFFAALYGRPPAEADALIDSFELGDNADRVVGQLSRGTVQRASLARALLPRPRLLLLDEPFSGLDARAVEQLRHQLEQISSDRIVVVITHDIESVDGLCDQLLVLRRGHLVSQTRGSAGRLLGAETLRRQYREAIADRREAST